MDIVQLQDNERYIRDMDSKAILNTDRSGLEAWKRRKEKADQIQRHEQQINTIESELAEIKELLKKLTQER